MIGSAAGRTAGRWEMAMQKAGTVIITRVREDVAVEIGKGGAQPVIPFLSDPGGNKEEIRNRAMSGLGACWAVAG